VPNYAVYIVGKQSKKNLDVTGASKSNETQVIIWPNNGGANQKWNFIATGDGYFNIQNVNSGKYLEIDGSSQDSGASAIQYTPNDNGGANQEFSIEGVAGYYIIKAAHSGQVLDVCGGVPTNGTKVIQYPYHGGDNQLWR